MIELIMVFHCHQPVGNFDSIFNMAIKRCYLPLLKILDEHPLFRCGLHFSGPLLEWMEDSCPEALVILERLIRRGQVEPFSGGFYEPILSSIPINDARGQILKMNRYMESRFDYKPKGLWLTERIWDPMLPWLLDGTGLRYTIVDDTHFFYAGLNKDQIYAPYITEKHGKELILFATPIKMRYIIPFKEVDQVIEHLHSLDDKGHDIAVYGDDGEKFGIWPGTYEWVIKKGWLKGFIKKVIENGEWLKTTVPGEYIEKYIASNRSFERIYIPEASYEEMTEWALPALKTKKLESIIKELKTKTRL